VKWFDKIRGHSLVTAKSPDLISAQSGSDALAPPASEPLARLVERAYEKKDLGDTEAALALFQTALARDSVNCSVLNGLGLVCADLARPDDALQYFERALQIDPEHVSSLCNSAPLLTQLGRAEEALRNCEHVLSLKPDFEPALSALAQALNRLGRQEEALSICDHLVERNPHRLQLRRNRAMILQDLGRYETALADLRAIAEFDPSDPNAQYSLAFNSLLCGDFETGWKAHESRWAALGVAAPHPLAGQKLNEPWDGKRSLQGKTILLHGEQGYGDNIQFSRYCKLVKTRGAHVLLGVPAALRRLFRELDGVDELVDDHQPLPHFDEYIALMSLPLAFGTRLETIPEQGRPFSAPPERIAAWQARLGQAMRPRIAVCWRGNPKFPGNANRSIPFNDFAALFHLPFEFLSMQIDLTKEETALLHNTPNVRDCGSELVDFEESAALLSCCELVISIDSAPAHLAGAMKKPSWILLCQRPDWRWLLNRSDSPWYPAMRLYRQTQLGQWGPILETVRRDLLATN